MADDLSLLFRLRADNAQAKAAVQETRAAVASLRQSLGPELSQSISITNKAFAQIGDNLNVFVGQRLPLAGGAFVRITENLRNFASESGKTENAVASVAKSIQTIAAESNKSVPQIATFLTKFVQIEGQANRDKAAVDFFGASLASKLIPQLEETGAAVGELSGEAAAAGSSLAAIAGPIGIAVIALAALVAGVAVAVDKLAELTVSTAEWQGALVDLSQQTGVSVETLNALDIALSKVGGNMGSATQSLINFQRQLDEAQDPSSKAAQSFARLGVSTRDTETSLREALKALAKMPEGFAQTNAAAELFGARGGKQFLALLKETHGDIDAVVAGLGDLGEVTTEQARKADEFNDALRDLQILLRGASALLVREVIPQATEALKNLQKILKDNEAAFKVLGGAVDLAAAAVSAFVRGSLFTLNTVLAAHRAEFEITAAIFERIANALKTIRGTGDEAAAPLKDAIDAATLLDAARKSFEAGLKPFDLKEIFGVDEKTTKVAKDALNNQLAELQETISVRNQAFQDETEKIKRELQQRTISFETYYRQQKGQNERQLAATLANLQTEREAVRRALTRGTLDATEAAQKQRQIDKQVRDAKREADREQQRLDDERVALKGKQDQAAIDVLRDTIDTQLRILSIGDDRRIESIRALAALRVQTEEDAERQILQIRLRAIDRERERLKSEVGILENNKTGDPEEVLKQKAHLNLQIRILDEERTSIEENGNRDIEAGRQKDLENERRYTDELKEIKERIRDIERDTAQEAIRLMRTHFASRRDIIKAQTQIDIDDENQRHQRAEDDLRKLEKENRESNKTQQEKFEFEQELNRLREAEEERHRLAMQGIRDQGKRDEEDTNPLGRILNIDTESIKEIANVIEQTIVPLGEILKNTFLQVSDAIGQTVANWVLLGETGPAVARKILAQALASLAAEAAVNAIKELALGFATLFFNPAESAAHFTAAGLWASIGGVASVAGRSVAGDLFKSKTGTGAGNGSNANGQGEINPLTLTRNSGLGGTPQIPPQIQPQRVQVQITVNDSKFGKAIDAHVVDGIANNGPIRQAINNDGSIAGR